MIRYILRVTRTDDAETNVKADVDCYAAGITHLELATALVDLLPILMRSPGTTMLTVDQERARREALATDPNNGPATEAPSIVPPGD